MTAASTPHSGFAFLSDADTTEGFLYPDSYVLPRATSTDELIEALLRNFELHLTTDLQEGFARQGLSVYEAVILASIVQREAVNPEEAPDIASVYLNRVNGQMPWTPIPPSSTRSDTTRHQGTWWTNPLEFGRPQVALPLQHVSECGFSAVSDRQSRAWARLRRWPRRPIPRTTTSAPAATVQAIMHLPAPSTSTCRIFASRPGRQAPRQSR